MSALHRALPPLTTVMSSHAVRTALVCALVALLALQGLRLLWLVITPVGPVGRAQPAAATAADLSALRRDVFNRSVADSTGDGVVLHGVRAGVTQAAAYLSLGDGRQGAYRVGDAVMPGVVLQAIAADHVLLRTGSGVRRLPLLDAVPQALATTPSAANTAAGTASGVMSNVGNATAAAGATAVDPQQLLTSAGLRASEDGSGFTVMPRGDGALLRQAGLAAGDVLTQINGRTLDAEHLRELQDELRDGQAATLTYRRDGQTHTMTLKRPQ
ncbi:type II secretion system protein N [Xanthomonas vesicatoria]|uniref:type II secretion system protein N n=1 Tax=Xanthomonas vesicatoria TaxID=56460 RepID=UPI0007321564|nr:type II secretion system protein N [Xanthomonas vesicatoria]KTF32591.1 type II secretion system protein C [Xanthomonas vesicatoria]MCC8558138.1 PDZ domain-containing protein [Xanthomonas vesicatoria]MCC8601024.1 PDZ domain-containing protein [Xanthomonas vesicatoria]MCC8609604.1 PDZ domain-containing protein [Xanthomonas vesicatoria]MCC8618559.1 PDZ domain-containing protein [Xanthomonas vesicatoria]